jgi:hypothetical protein
MRLALCFAGAGALAACGLPLDGASPGATDAGRDGAGRLPDPGGPDAARDSASGDATGDAVADAPAGDDGRADASEASAPGAGWALQFDANHSYVDMGVVPIPGDFTLEAWVYPHAYAGETYVVAEDRNGQGQGQFRFGFVASGALFFMMSDGAGNSFGLYGGTGYLVQSPSAVPTETWSEVAVARSGTRYQLFVGGAQVEDVLANGSFVFNDGGHANPLRVGSRVHNDGTGPDGVFDGAIDEVRIWNVARTQAEIAADMSHELTAADPAWGNLVQYWPFDEGTGTKTADRTGNFQGTLVGGPQWIVSGAF